MSLPKLVTQRYNITLPSGKKMEYRPFTMRHEEVMLNARESEDTDAIFNSITDVLNDCTFTKYDISTLQTADIEYLFLMIRARSVSEVVKLRFFCDDDDKTGTVVEVKLPDVKTQAASETKDIEIGETEGGKKLYIRMKFPTLEATRNTLTGDTVSEMLLIKYCIDQMFDDDTSYDMTSISDDEFKEWYGELPRTVKDSIRDFFAAAPKIYYDVKYTCNHCKNQKTKRLEGIQNFFGLG